MIENRSVTPFGTEPLYADVVVPRHLPGPFTYKIPTALAPIIHVGHLVVVPFGRTTVYGAVIELSRSLPEAVDRSRIREVQGLADDPDAAEIPSFLLRLARRVSDSYVAPLGQCLRLVIPPTASRSTKTRLLKLTVSGREILASGSSDVGDARALMERLSRKPAGIKQSTLLGKGGSGSVVNLEELLAKGWIEQVRRIPPASPNGNGGQAIQLNHRAFSGDASHGSMQEPFEWENRLTDLLMKRQPGRLAFQACTDDRVEVLKRTAGRALALGRTVMVLVGEADRAEWLAERLSKTTEGEIACFHSSLTEDRKVSIWEQTRRRRVHIVVGTRSAVFLPLQNLGLIWIERDEDSALKEPQEPRYHAREVAWIRAHDEQALLIQSSPHLSLESIALVQPDVLSRPSPVTPGPSIEVVDLRRDGRNNVLGSLMTAAIHEAIDRRLGALLFLNRKGYAGALVCRDCGQIPRCQSCEVALPYYRQTGRLSCSYCGASAPLPDTCGTCGGPHLQVIGEGTERVEDEVRKQFPHARIIRADGETMRRPAQALTLWNRIKRQDWDVLIGTQLLLRDHAVSRVGLVGIVQADSSLSRPDFRAAERTYHQLLDAIGLARAAHAGGRVIIQSYLPHHHAIQAAARSDETIFRIEELFHRTALMYPPAVHLIALHVSGTQAKTVRKAAADWAAQLNEFPDRSVKAPGSTTSSSPTKGRESLVVLGPVSSPVPRLRGRYRLQILVKSPLRELGIQAVRCTVMKLERAYPPRAAKFDVDVDPVDMW